jgi:flagellar protein FliT
VNQLPRYRALSEESSRMVAAARRDDWMAVFDAEERCRVIVNELRALPDNALSAPERDEKRSLIEKILVEDREIRDLAQPWMKRMHESMTAAGNQRRLDASYGAAP